ncbi:BTB/POZ and MATH domain-containing protein 1-like [Triticum urartu]|uniref:BTB/POZ and MATH domain-containing protein 1-like n=1 Tax=Triticum urartu TaxID=4572 RepID=UPI002042BF4A|nr:BTB/POZ and MATH domain-containing protein 1-like [Triticum urartu]
MGNRSSSSAKPGQSPSETASRCLTESFTGTHDFEIVNYSLLVVMGVGKFVSSSTFCVGGYNWNIRLYPDGVMKDYAGKGSVFLHHLCSPDSKGVRTKFTLSVLEKHGQVTRALVDHIFPRAHTSDGFGYTRFFDNSKLKTMPDLYYGSLTIRCVLTIIKESRTELKTNLAVAPPSNLQEHLRHMHVDGDGADVTFSVRGQLFNAHRCLLAARSPVFKAELFGPMKENSTRCIEIDDIEPQVFEALLHFIYTDCMMDGYEEGKTENLQHLLVAADLYGVERLRVMCEGKLCDSVNLKTVATTLTLAEQHNCGVLKKACIEFVASGKTLEAVKKTDSDVFKHLEASCPHLMQEILFARMPPM